MAQPAVGIFWLIGEKVLIDATPVDDAEDYADHKTHGRSHDECWAEMVRSGTVPDGDYEEHPRGRVVFNAKTRQFTMYADQCILRQRKSGKADHAPDEPSSATATSRDAHYRCFTACGGSPTNRDQSH